MTVREFILGCDAFREKKVTLMIDGEEFITSYFDNILQYMPYKFIENKDFILFSQYNKNELFTLAIMTRKFEDEEKIVEPIYKEGSQKLTHLVTEITDDWPYKLFINGLRIPGLFTIEEILLLEINKSYTYDIDKQSSEIYIYSKKI